MSVKVENLTKVYGKQKAVDHISFEVKPGEVVGFLGPNGAGKSTTMKIITCFIPQTEGKASVAGYDINENPMEVRSHIGYLPENNPLYLEMYVKEYLEFIAGLHEVKNKKERIKEMIELTGLTIEQNKKVQQLSKGYRQRLGIAQAMLHDPEVLILDEPTSGLDPNQLVEIRGLIRELGKQKTVILSTHIMQEVQAICNRVIIIHKGKIVADDTTKGLQEKTGKGIILHVEFDKEITAERLKSITSIRKVTELENNRWQLHSDDEKVQPEIFKFASEHDLTILEIKREETSLENIFQQLTR